MRAKLEMNDSDYKEFKGKASEKLVRRSTKLDLQGCLLRIGVIVAGVLFVLFGYSCLKWK